MVLIDEDDDGFMRVVANPPKPAPVPATSTPAAPVKPEAIQPAPTPAIPVVVENKPVKPVKKKEVKHSYDDDLAVKVKNTFPPGYPPVPFKPKRA